MASSVAMNKEKAKNIMKAAGVPVAQSRVMHRLEAAWEHAMPAPYVVKPVSEGSSFGVLIVDRGQAHPPQELYSADWPYGDIVMVERFVPGRELTCAAMGECALDVTEILANNDSFYDYEAKYARAGHLTYYPLILNRIFTNIYNR